jgi:hypothetical protein
MSVVELLTRRKIRLIKSNATCRHMKKLTSKGTLRQVFIRVFRLKIANLWCTLYSQSCWYFRPSFVNCCPSNLLSGSTRPPIPCAKVQYIYRQCVAHDRGWGVVESLWRPYSAGVYNTLYLTRFRTYKIARPPQTKT